MTHSLALDNGNKAQHYMESAQRSLLSAKLYRERGNDELAEDYEAMAARFIEQFEKVTQGPL